jgi:hypothetical protein
MGIKLQGGNNSSNLVNVNDLNQLQVVTTQDSAGFSAGFVQMSTEVDAGDVTGSRSVQRIECSDDYRTRVGVDQTLFNTTFESGTILTTQWSNTNSIASSAQANGFLTLNSSPTLTSAAAAYVRSHRLFPTFGTYPTYLDMWIREAGWNAINTISEWGFLYLTAVATQQPLDGIFFRRTSGGQLKGVVTTGISATVGIDTFEIDLDTTAVPARSDENHSYDPSEANHYLISFHNDSVRFWINDVLVGEVKCRPQLAQFAGSSNLPVGFRVVNVAAADSARQVSVGYVNVGIGDQNTNKPWSHAMVGSGQGSYQTQIGSTPASTVTRSAGIQGHPASGTARSTTAWAATTQPGTNSNNLGGLWTSSALSALASDVDYPLFAFLNPAGTATLPGKTLYVTGVRMGETNITTAPGVTGAFFSYIVQVENSAAATSTADAATTVSGKATVIGGQGFAPNDPVGTMKPGFQMTFDPPLVVPAGRYCTVIARPFGTIGGGTLVVTGSVAFNGYFE